MAPKVKRLVSIVVGFLIIVLVLFISINWWLEQNLRSLMNQQPDMIYRIDYESVRINPLFSGISLNSFSITPVEPDSAANLIKINADYAQVAGIAFSEFIFSRKINVNSFVLVNPQVSVAIEESRAGKNEVRESIQQLLEDVFTRFTIHKLEVKQGNIDAFYKHDKNLIGAINNLNLVARNLYTDHTQWQLPIPIDLEDFRLSADSISYTWLDKSHLKLRNVQYNTVRDHVSIEDLTISPGEERSPTSLYEMNIKKLESNSIFSLRNELGELDIRMQAINIDYIALKYRMDQDQLDPAESAPKEVAELINQVPWQFKIDTIYFDDAQFSLAPFNDEDSYVTLKNMNGQLVNLSNLPLFQNSYGHLSASLTGVMNDEAHTSFALTAAYGLDDFSVKASLSDLDMTSLNSLTMPFASVRINSGHLHHTTLHIIASRDYADIQLNMDYSDFDIDLLKRKNDTNKVKRITSFFADAVVRDSNLPEHKRYKNAEFRTVRDQESSIVEFMQESVQDGVEKILIKGKN